MPTSKTARKTADDWIRAGAEYLADNDFRSALAAFDCAVSTKPVCTDAHFGRAVALLELDRFDECEEAIEKAYELDPTDHEKVAEYSNFLGRSGLVHEALAMIERTLPIDDDDLYVLVQHGVSLAAVGRREEALGLFGQALRSDCTFVDAYVSRAGALADMERFTDALADLDTAIALEPDHPFARDMRHLTVMRRRAGRLGLDTSLGLRRE